MLDWVTMSLELGDIDSHALEVTLEEAGAAAISYSDAGDEPVLEPALGETRLWPQTLVSAVFPAETVPELVRGLVSSRHGQSCAEALVFDSLADRDWLRESRNLARPMQFGSRLWVCPRGQVVADRDSVTLILEPGLAFGTGEHPTTSMCLEWLTTVTLAHRSVLDFGCGSGVLAIAALLMGAGSSVAIDIDPQAIAATLSNADENGVSARLVAREPHPQDKSGSFDIVIANIVSGTLIERAGELAGRCSPGARIALSGILVNQAGAVIEAWKHYADLSVTATSDDWVLLTGRHGD